MHSSICSTIFGWMPSVGSSISNNLGSEARARAIANCCCWPPDKTPPGRSRFSIRYGKSSATRSGIFLPLEDAKPPIKILSFIEKSGMIILP